MGYREGRSASPGLAFGRAYIYKDLDLSFSRVAVNDPDQEILRLKGAFARSKQELERIKNTLSGDMGQEFGHIFRAQITMVEDEEFNSDISDMIRGEKICAEAALDEVFSGYAALFASLGEDDYNRQRLLDLTDVYKRILRNLLGLEEKNLACVPKNSIVIAKDLMPSDTALMNKDHVFGLITEKGGVTSHVAILAKSLGIPAAVGALEILEEATPDGRILLDTLDLDTAKIWVNPEDAECKRFIDKQKSYEQRRNLFEQVRGKEAVTTDGHRVELSANIGSLKDMERALEFGAKGVGLLRTEFFFLNTLELPNEEQQYEFYKRVAQEFNPNMVIIRTLDIGGDKEIQCFDLPQEDNPFLGLRGIRVCLKHRDIFKTQLRAILRAALYGNIKIMFPMVSSVSELRIARSLIEQCAEELRLEGKKYCSAIEIGVMIETPAAVMISDILTEECDFVSVGTNDLTQYTLCADRINQDVSEYYRIFSPAIFRAIEVIVENAHKNGAWVSICGELGGTLPAVPLLVGLGVDDLSVTGQVLPELTSLIRGMSLGQCKNLATKVRTCKTEEDIKTLLKDNLEDILGGIV